jgi:serine protease Do
MGRNPHQRIMNTVAFLAAGFATASAVAQTEPFPAELNTAVSRASASVIPALVRIHVVDVDYWDGREVKSEATGSGVIFTPDGHIITNHHVAGRAAQITCTLADKRKLDAELVGTDPLTDICVIKLLPPTAESFPVARFGDSEGVRVGDPVLAMGSPLALSQSVTLGIVSNTQLVMPDLLWPFAFELEGEDVGSIIRWIGHDAEIGPGSSGGPLVNLDGEVIGINEMEFGLGAAIPGSLALSVARELVASGRIARAWLGLEVQPLLESQHGETGVLVGGSIPDSPAERAGFLPGDLLVSLDGQSVHVRHPEELPGLNRLIAGLPVGIEVEAVVLRHGGRHALRVVPQEREMALPLEREFPEWGMTGRDLSLVQAKEMRRPKSGVFVTSLRPGGPCSEARPAVVEGDVITGVGATRITTSADLTSATQQLLRGADDPIPTVVLFDRGPEHHMTVVEVGRRPLPEPAVEVRKAWLGVTIQVLTRELAKQLGLEGRTGVRITQVLPGSVAEHAGLQVGDFIIGLDGEDIPASRPQHVDVFQTMIRRRAIGSDAELAIIRDGAELTLTVHLEESPKAEREMSRYRDESFEFTVRDLTVNDRFRRQWPSHQQGALVEVVSEGGWAALGHLGVGDLIVQVDGREVRNIGDLECRMSEVAVEKPDTVVFRVQRGIHSLFVELEPKWAETVVPSDAGEQ